MPRRRPSRTFDLFAKVAFGIGLAVAVVVNTGLLQRHAPASAEETGAVARKDMGSPETPVASADADAGGTVEKLIASASPVPAPLVVKRILDVPHPFEHGDWMWDDTGVPDGPVVITVDRAAQTLSVFRGGYEIGAAVVLYGADRKPTPLGTFPITQKDATHFSSTYDRAPMPYMLRLTGDGVSIHGSKVAWGYATHGCIGVPIAFAKKLFAAVKLGDPVIVTDGKRLGMGQAITQS